MRHSWLLDVLTHMQTYARRNGLPRLAVHLDDTLRIARTEVAPDPVALREGERPVPRPRHH